MNRSVVLNRNLMLLARVLERLERSNERVDARQYQSVVNYLASELAAAPRGAALAAVLLACPATAELYENLNYQHAGLCRTALEIAVAADNAARVAIDNARRR